MTENMIFVDCVIFRRLYNFSAACQSFFRKMEAVIELKRSKNLRLGVFIIVGAAVYFAEKFVRDLRDQNGTLSKLEGPREDFGPKNKVKV